MTRPIRCWPPRKLWSAPPIRCAAASTASSVKLRFSEPPRAGSEAPPPSMTRRSERPVLLGGGGRFSGREHDDFGADRGSVVEINDVVIRQADAAGRDIGADGPRLVGPVDAIKRVLVALPQIHRPRANRIVGTALHADPALQLHHVLAQLRLARQHFRGRVPIGPFLLAMNGRKPRPNKTFRADPYAIANGLPVALDEVEKMTAGIDDDGSWPLARRIGDNRACEGGIRRPRLLRCRREDVEAGRSACAGRKRQQRRAGQSLPDPHSPREQSTDPLFHKDILNQKWP